MEKSCVAAIGCVRFSDVVLRCRVLFYLQKNRAGDKLRLLRLKVRFVKKRRIEKV